MITLQKLSFDNLFSYGTGNTILFDSNPITQLVGKNGHGKSSIALILEEAIFNKNSKGIKKTDILNRYVKDKSYSISLSFTKDTDEYIINTTRASTQTVKLLKNGEDISSHTATATFKLIEEIIGMDHKAFSQLVYQSSSSSLEFLTATDTNRKKFLIELLNLGKYLEAFEIFKAAAKEVSDEVLKLESSINTTKSWLDKHSKTDLTEKTTREVPTLDKSISTEITEHSARLHNIEDLNKRITKNNQCKKHLGAINLDEIKEEIVAPEDTAPLSSKVGEYSKAIKDSSALIAKISKLDGVCPTCLQLVDKKKLEELVAEQEEISKEANAAITKLNLEINKSAELRKKYDKVQKLKTEYEQYHSLIDDSLQDTPLDSDNLKIRISELKDKVQASLDSIAEIEKYNSSVVSHNAKVQVIKEQMQSMKDDLANYHEKLAIVNENLSYLQILQKTFSTSGLLAYKIECLVKDLENMANIYLSDLSDGRFQLTFKITASDKLNVVVTDNGNDIDMLALSGGERARVNTATLLAIRKLMQSLSDSRINLLVLDETIDALDVEGKEKLVEVLIKEEHLNTFLVSHGFTHPLLEKITVIKENNISRLE